ncbi:phage gp6-like head-tail connector protein [Bosea sp. ASV33]|uniref:phage gp6-like head-tail connector protein n=1 Tax=Bosea sp. ASV33 TaxID=2795106 RepID=UPI0018ED0E3A|nr:phage gp6-like head-tail connector protein [Bosea sp. ASV33]
MEEAKRHLIISGAGRDDDIKGLIAAVTAQIDGPDGWLGLSLGQQVLEWQGNAFPDGWPIELLCGPVSEVQSINYLDASGVSASVSLADVELHETSLYPREGFHWPRSACRPGAVRIRYKAGHAAEDLPPQVVPALKLMLGDLWSAARAGTGIRKEVVEGIGSTEWEASTAFNDRSNRAVTALLLPLRVYP